MKRKLLSVTLSAAMVLTLLPATAFAADVTTPGEQATPVTYNKASSYTVTLPDSITVGTSKTQTYEVSVKGDVAAEQEVFASPKDTVTSADGINFEMKDQNGSGPRSAIITMVQDKTTFQGNDIAEDGGTDAQKTTGTITIPDTITAGIWAGNATFEIGLKDIYETTALSAFTYTQNDTDHTIEITGLTTEGKTLTELNIGSTYNFDNGVASNSLLEDMGLVMTADAAEVPYTVTSIGANAFSGCTSLTMTIPETVTTINENAFANVPHIYYTGSATGTPWGAIAIN